MTRDPRGPSRKGAAPKTEPDGSTTLYGIEDWTEVESYPVYLIVPRDPGSASPPPDAGDGKAEPGSAEGEEESTP